jgi:hypothetical protein
LERHGWKVKSDFTFYFPPFTFIFYS